MPQLIFLSYCNGRKARSLTGRPYSWLFDKSVPTMRATDLDLSLPTWNPDRRLTGGALEKAVLLWLAQHCKLLYEPYPNRGPAFHKPCILRTALINIPWKHPKYGKYERKIRNKYQNIQPWNLRDKCQQQAQNKQRKIQLVWSIPPCHKTLKPIHVFTSEA